MEHVQTLTDDALISPNNLVALPDGSLFISNDFQDLGGVAGLIVDTVLNRKRAPLVYYDGTEFMDLDANVMSSAGITAVKEGDNEYLYRDMMNKGVEKLQIHWDQPGNPGVSWSKPLISIQPARTTSPWMRKGLFTSQPTILSVC